MKLLNERMHHIQHTHEERKHTSWCGERINPHGWNFQDLDHAAYSIQQHSYATPCPYCVEAAIKALQGKSPTPLSETDKGEA